MKNRDEINAFLGRDTEFEGKLSFKGAVRIDGHFTGEIFTEGTLIVGESAVIKSDIHVSHGCSPGYFNGTFSKSTIKPPHSFAISATEHDSPPAPLSVMLL